MSAPLSVFKSHPVGLGCMNMSHAYNKPVPDDEAVQGFREAFDMGYRHFDTATLYGGGRNERLVGKALKSVRHDIFLASKCVLYIDPETGKGLDGRPETIKAQCEASLKRLQTDHIDLYYLHRRDFNVPIEESAGAMADLIKEGKIAHYGLSEMSAETLRAAHKEHPVTAMQTEYSVWTRNPEIAVLETCRELETTFVAFSPLARGFLSLTIDNLADLEADDVRHLMPRFYPENFEKNKRLLEQYKIIAQRANCSPAQLALAWLRAKDPSVISIPGTRHAKHMRDNLESAEINLSKDIVTELEQLINRDTIAGERYSAKMQTEIDTEQFA